MKEAKHTPGPWEVSKGYDGSISVSATRPYRINNISAGTPVICDVYQHLEFDSFSGEANARLIAAAPELLDALRGLLALEEENLRGYDDIDVCTEVQFARAAIAKATGRVDSVDGSQKGTP